MRFSLCYCHSNNGCEPMFVLNQYNIEPILYFQVMYYASPDCHLILHLMLKWTRGLLWDLTKVIIHWAAWAEICIQNPASRKDKNVKEQAVCSVPVTDFIVLFVCLFWIFTLILFGYMNSWCSKSNKATNQPIVSFSSRLNTKHLIILNNCAIILI